MTVIIIIIIKCKSDPPRPPLRLWYIRSLLSEHAQKWKLGKHYYLAPPNSRHSTHKTKSLQIMWHTVNNCSVGAPRVMNVTPFTSNVIKIQLLGSLYKYLGIWVVRVNSSIDWSEYFSTQSNRFNERNVSSHSLLRINSFSPCQYLLLMIADNLTH